MPKMTEEAYIVVGDLKAVRIIRSILHGSLTPDMVPSSPPREEYQQVNRILSGWEDRLSESVDIP